MNTRNSLSILIPCYNDHCSEQVHALQAQAHTLGMDYEILVADDASTLPDVVAANSAIDLLPNCRYIKRQHNVGRAAIRNFLADQARGTWLLFLDCDVVIPRAFLHRYAAMMGQADVIYGGVKTAAPTAALASNLRYRYEQREERHHSAAARSRSPYKSFRTTNFMISREAMAANRFDESIHHYGYEDVLFGLQLQENYVSITHFDNPVQILHYEDNALYLSKIEEAMRTLHSLRYQLGDFSPLLRARTIAKRCGLLPLLRHLHRHLAPPLRRHLLQSPRPSVALFNLHKLLYLASL